MNEGEAETMTSEQGSWEQLERMENEIREAAQRGIRTCVYASTEGLTANQMRDRLDTIKTLLTIQDRAKNLVHSYGDGPDNEARALAVIGEINQLLTDALGVQ
jgi:hypothetical protein